jgi:hypothetical protein
VRDGIELIGGDAGAQVGGGDVHHSAAALQARRMRAMTSGLLISVGG